ncbi:hypothetical protein [Rufibacter sp. XAAS-G3-1]|uniref:hypothetical protein n=1 Tax=Rufibacter sp. XAAS-G3-1 TaxID=2729134 RepID=UPI0015E72BDB|nr:hypothetical protein [Rufibacter sp. XAAS-G3-1]
MKKLLIIGLGAFVFACGGGNETTRETTTDLSNTDESVEIGSGQEISPQLEGDSDSAHVDVDTVSNAQEVQHEQEKHQ